MTCFIDQEWQPGLGPAFQSKDPLERELVWEGHEASQEQIEACMKSANKAFQSWRSTTIEERVQCLLNYKEQLVQHQEDMATLISKEMGKPFWESKTEVQAMIGKLDISLQAQQERCGRRENQIGDAKSITQFHPIGVCLIIGPFNLPAHLPNGHLIPALLAGNTVVFKPSEKCPGIAHKMMELLAASGFPKGVVQLLQGKANVSRALVSHPLVDIVAFTGSYKVGAAIHKALGGQPEKMLALEMGGNNPLVVWESKSPKKVAYHTILSSFITSGQRCVCARRLFIPEGNKGDAILEALKQQVSKIKVATWEQNPEGFMGPLVDAQAGQWVLDAQKKAITNGAIVHSESKPIDHHTALLSPGLLEWEDYEAFKSSMGDEEVFGPLLQVFRVHSLEQAIERANDTNYGLAAGLISDHQKHWNQFKQQISAGIVNWNRQITGAFSSAPFGGVGFSGNFRPSAYLAADYCSYPSAYIEVEELALPEQPMTGLEEVLK